jgi:twitching motility protein PilT
MAMTQRLFKRADGAGRVAAFEIMVANPAVRNLIRDDKVFQITSIMQTARGEGMKTMEASIEELITSGQITADSV